MPRGTRKELSMGKAGMGEGQGHGRMASLHVRAAAPLCMTVIKQEGPRDQGPLSFQERPKNSRFYLYVFK